MAESKMTIRKEMTEQTAQEDSKEAKLEESKVEISMEDAFDKIEKDLGEDAVKDLITEGEVVEEKIVKEKKVEASDEKESDAPADEEKPKTKKIEKKSAKETKKKNPRSQKYIAATSDFEKEKLYSVDEAIDLAKKMSYSKFVGSMELHIKIAQTKSKKKGPTETNRFLVDLPFGTGKTKEIVVLDEAIIEEIFKTKSATADIYLATPEIMPKVGKIARILGTQGKMPNPKSGTVTTDIEKTKEALASGRIELRADGGNVFHQTVGKLDFENDKLKQNIAAVLSVLPKAKIKSLVIAPTMGAGIKVKI
ncbi:MAG: hypothetical protein WCW17_01985 [Patescibacteria group bacterium]